MLELSNAHKWEGGGCEVLPVPIRAQGSGVLLQLPKRLQTQLLLHRLLQQ